jgi:uncharacterized protein YndB with AHSA1/START domain
MAKKRSISRTRLIRATPEKIFDVLANPTLHSRIDGSKTVLGHREHTTDRLALGSKFGMNMKVGARYKITNVVVEFEANHKIAWRHFGGHRWRYELEPVDGGTKVVETFDWSTSHSPFMIELARYPARNAKSIERTLDRLAEFVETMGDTA